MEPIVIYAWAWAFALVLIGVLISIRAWRR
jgi:hypothetical protein